MTQYARDWVRLYTKGKGTFTTTQMEDAGFMNAIERLAATCIVLIVNRVHHPPHCQQLLRSSAPATTAAESITAPYIGGKASP